MMILSTQSIYLILLLNLSKGIVCQFHKHLRFMMVRLFIILFNRSLYSYKNELHYHLISYSLLTLQKCLQLTLQYTQFTNGRKLNSIKQTFLTSLYQSQITTDHQKPMRNDSKSEPEMSPKTAYFKSDVSFSSSLNQNYYDWVPCPQPDIEKQNIILRLQEFYQKSRPINLSGYDGLYSLDAMRHKNMGVIYIGTWSQGVPEGFGTFYYDSGIIYEGYIREGKLQGFGILIMDNQEYFIGNFKDDKPQGQVVFKGKNMNFSGEFVNGEELITAKVFNQNGNKKKEIIMSSHKQGTIKYSGGQIYKGQILQLTPNGVGTMVYPHGDFYEGYFKKGMFSGKGTYYWKQNNCRFQGYYQDNLKNGIGKFYHSNQLVQKCYWEMGDKKGDTIILYKGKEVYRGSNQKKILQMIDLHLPKNN